MLPHGTRGARRALSLALLTGAAFVAPLALSAAMQACTSGGGGDAGADGNPNANPCQDGTIQLGECAEEDGAPPNDRFSDEACQGLDDAEHRAAVQHDDTRAPAIDQPTEGAALPSATPFTFAWHPTGISLAPARATTPRAFAFRDDLARWTTLVPAAEAHCAPFGGIGYAVVFKADGQEILRAETANMQYVPTADAWMRLRAARGTITMTVEVARFTDDRVTEGPVDQATPRTFTITP